MKPKILLTSFQTWLPHQKSNSSDDILVEIQKLDYSHYVSLFFLRNLPVNIELAAVQVIHKIIDVQPDVVICCGMAEKRDKLTIESSAFCENQCLTTKVNLAKLTKKLILTEVSHDTGKFVCEGLYYQILKYIQAQSENRQCLFVHVPLLKNNHLDSILKDFRSILLFFTHKSRKQQD